MDGYPAITIRSYGVPLEISLPPQFRTAPPMDYLPQGYSVARADPQVRISLEAAGQSEFRIRVDGRMRERSLRRQECLSRLKKHIEIQVAERSPERVFLHAAMVDWDGLTVLLPGPTYAGKSTLTWDLVRAGATYCGDEFALLDLRGRARAYPAPLTLRRNGFRRVVSEAAGSPGSARRPGMILFTRYRPGSRWDPRPVSAGTAALLLFQNTVSARQDPQRVLRAVGRLARGVPAYFSDRPDSRGAVEWLRAWKDRND